MNIHLAFVLIVAMACSVSHSWKMPVPKMSSQTQSTPSSFETETKKAVVSASKTAAVVLLSSLILPVYSMADEGKTKKIKKPKVLETELGIPYIELKKGSGPYPSKGDYVVIDYTAFLKNGTVYDSTEVKGRKPLSFRYGFKQAIPGVESVLGYMQPGGEATCSIPAKYAYGDKGVCVQGEGCIVPPNEDIKYAIKLRNVGSGFN